MVGGGEGKAEVGGKTSVPHGSVGVLAPCVWCSSGDLSAESMLEVES